jgi:hypothetical protein
MCCLSEARSADRRVDSNWLLSIASPAAWQDLTKVTWVRSGYDPNQTECRVRLFNKKRAKTEHKRLVDGSIEFRNSLMRHRLSGREAPGRRVGKKSPGHRRLGLTELRFDGSNDSRSAAFSSAVRTTSIRLNVAKGETALCGAACARSPLVAYSKR